MNLLYVEDNKDLAKTVKDYLKHWFNVDLAHCYKSGLSKADTTDYDVIILDFFLPGGNGIKLCHEIRQSNTQSLILLLSQNQSKADIVKSLNTGADDYLTKPFDFEELKARIHALIRRKYTNSGSQIIAYKEISIDQKKMSAFYKNRSIELKRKEFLLLEYLVLHHDQVISRSRLYESVWNKNYYVSNTVDVHIKRLRGKLEKVCKKPIIKTIYGTGYQLSVD